MSLMMMLIGGGIIVFVLTLAIGFLLRKLLK